MMAGPLLHLAADNGHREVMQLLLIKDADIQVMTNDGWTPSSYGCSEWPLEGCGTVVG